jgi:uncharacterized protein YodC (DUF2158 family)
MIPAPNDWKDGARDTPRFTDFIRSPFKVGDVVRLKSGGPRMTVTHVDQRPYVHCAWITYIDAQPITGCYPADCVDSVGRYDHE